MADRVLSRLDEIDYGASMRAGHTLFTDFAVPDDGMECHCASMPAVCHHVEDTGDSPPLKPNCCDFPGWADSEGKNCANYQYENVARFGTTFVCDGSVDGAVTEESKYKRFEGSNLRKFADALGVTAADACCACGGGIELN